MARINRKTAPEGLADPFASTHGLRIIVKSYAQVKGLYGLSTSETVAFLFCECVFLESSANVGGLAALAIAPRKAGPSASRNRPAPSTSVACAEPACPERSRKVDGLTTHARTHRSVHPQPARPELAEGSKG